MILRSLNMRRSEIEKTLALVAELPSFSRINKTIGGFFDVAEWVCIASRHYNSLHKCQAYCASLTANTTTCALRSPSDLC